MIKSDTPISDNSIENIIVGDHEGYSETNGPWVHVDVARKLERELNHVKLELNHLKQQLSEFGNDEFSRIKADDWRFAQGNGF